MTPRELRKQVRENQRVLRERVAAMPQVQKARRAARLKRLQRALMVALVLLLLSFIRCDCGTGPTHEPPDAGLPSVEPKKPKPPQVKVVKPGPLSGKVSLGPRDGFDPTARTSLDWLDAFRLQVAARSPRLAECFQGTERPGALRWACAVNPDSGAVSDQSLEPLGASVELTREQRACLVRVLASPPYKSLTTSTGQPLPNRVSMIIEF